MFGSATSELQPATSIVNKEPPGGNSVGAEKHSASKSLARFIAWWVCIFVLVYIFSRCVVMCAYIPSDSMEPTMAPGDRVLASCVSYYFDDPEYGDVAIFWNDQRDSYLIKRVIGTPGDRIRIDENGVMLNGKMIDEGYTMPGSITEPGNVQGEITVPEGKYFVMGDNRENSADSRYLTPKKSTWFICKSCLTG